MCARAGERAKSADFNPAPCTYMRRPQSGIGRGLAIKICNYLKAEVKQNTKESIILKMQFLNVD